MGAEWVQRRIWALGARMSGGDERMRALIATNGIVIFVGPNGSGKSLLAVESVLPTLAGVSWACDDLAHLHNRPVAEHVAGCLACVLEPREHGPRRWLYCPAGEALQVEHSTGVRLVYSTLPLLDEFGDPHPLYRPLRRIPQLVSIEHADVVFDEVAGVSDASDSAQMPPAFTRWLQQLRKRDVFLRVTTPAYKRCSLPIRQVATLIVDCRSRFEEPSQTGRLWRPRRAVLARAYDAFTFADFDKNSGERLETLASWFYWRPTGAAQSAYDTLSQVLALVDVAESGSCTVCNGTRAKPKCECDPEVYDLPVDELEVVETTTARGARARKAVWKGAAGTPPEVTAAVAGAMSGAGKRRADVPGDDTLATLR